MPVRFPAVPIVSSILVSAIPTSLAAQVTLEADRTTVSSGDTVRIRWSAPGARQVFLSSVGLVDASGEHIVSPDASTDYVLTAEGEDGVSTARIRVAVSGAKNGDSFPPSDAFGFPFNYREHARSFPELLDRVHDVLQNRMGHPVRTYQEPQEMVVFETMTRVRSDLVDPGETRVGRRRIAYRVQVPPPRSAGPRAYSYQVETLLQYQLRSERTWRRDNDSARRAVHSRALADSLASAEADGPGRGNP